VREGETEREYLCVYMWVYVYVCACWRVGVRVCVHACVIVAQFLDLEAVATFIPRLCGAN